MAPEELPLEEAEAAGRTLELFVDHVVAHVGQKLALVGEALGTLAALEGSRVVLVGPQVSLVMVARA